MRNKSGILLVFTSIAILLSLIWWRKSVVTDEVTTHITYNGEPVKQTSLQQLLYRMLPNEIISDGKICARNLFTGGLTCFDGDPVDVLIKRG